MRGFSKLPPGCLTVLILAIAVWVAVQFIFMPSVGRHVENHGHTLKDCTDRLFHGR
ncbi:MAG: hypothetical protein WC701_00010 [Kiritimatiellales bacterium]|jgi:hypothetical protein